MRDERLIEMLGSGVDHTLYDEHREKIDLLVRRDVNDAVYTVVFRTMIDILNAVIEGMSPFLVMRRSRDDI
jgi:hypothetical protein